MKPVTQAEVDQFVEFWENVKDDAEAMIDLVSQLSPTFWWERSCFYDISTEGLVFAMAEQDDGVEFSQKVLPWSLILDENSLVALKTEQATRTNERQLEMQKTMDASERAAYERLKVKFEGGA